jgi:hypothetical protein
MPWAGVLPIASTQRGVYNFTEPTGSPISDTGMEVPILSRSVLVIVIPEEAVCAGK